MQTGENINKHLNIWIAIIWRSAQQLHNLRYFQLNKKIRKTNLVTLKMAPFPWYTMDKCYRDIECSITLTKNSIYLLPISLQSAY